MNGLVVGELKPSPKFLLRETILPSLSLERLVYDTRRPLTDEVKFATGATLPPPPPPAASTAALAWRMPVPIGCDGVDGNARAVFLMIVSTSAGVFGVAETAWMSAITPATCGVAIEVPL